MKEFIEKLIGRLEERQNDIVGNLSLNAYYSDGYDKGIEYAIEIVNQLAEEYEQTIDVADLVEKYGQKNVLNDGWIACSERLPEVNEELFSDDLLVSFKESNDLKIAFYDGNKEKWYLRSSAPYIGQVIAWQPLPAPYQPKGE